MFLWKEYFLATNDYSICLDSSVIQAAQRILTALKYQQQATWDMNKNDSDFYSFFREYFLAL